MAKAIKGFGNKLAASAVKKIVAKRSAAKQNKGKPKGGGSHR